MNGQGNMDSPSPLTNGNEKAPVLNQPGLAEYDNMHVMATSLPAPPMPG